MASSGMPWVCVTLCSSQWRGSLSSPSYESDIAAAESAAVYWHMLTESMSFGGQLGTGGSGISAK